MNLDHVRRAAGLEWSRISMSEKGVRSAKQAATLPISETRSGGHSSAALGKAVLSRPLLCCCLSDGRLFANPPSGSFRNKYHHTGLSIGSRHRNPPFRSLLSSLFFAPCPHQRRVDKSPEFARFLSSPGRRKLPLNDREISLYSRRSLQNRYSSGDTFAVDCVHHQTLSASLGFFSGADHPALSPLSG